MLKNDNQKVFKVEETWGVASLRQCTGFVLEDQYTAPLGCSLIQWDLQRQQRSSLKQIHDDLVTVMLLSPPTGNILTVSYSGEVKLWKNTFDLLACFHLPTDNIVYGNWSSDGSEFCVTSKGPNQRAVVYNYNTVLKQCRDCQPVTPKWTYSAPQPHHENEAAKNKRKTFACFSAAIFKTNNELIAVYQSVKRCQLYLFSTAGVFLKKALVSPLGDEENDMLCVTGESRKNMIAIGLHRGVFGFYDVDTLELLRVLQATGAPRACLWSGDIFVAAAFTAGVVTLWNTDGHLLQTVKGGPTGSIVQITKDTKDDSTFYLGGIMSLHKVQIKDDVPTMIRNTDISYLSLTGCGVAVNSDDVIATGDFSGNVFLWRPKCRSPLATANITASVRSLIWVDQDILLIGTLNAQIMCWQNASRIDDKPKIDTLYNCIGDVAKLKMDSKGGRLAVGTTAGYLYVFTTSRCEQGLLQLTEDYSIQIHKPKQQSVVGGGVGVLNMEIWSLFWSPNDKYIATTSEDQTTIISNAVTGEHVHTLTGHTTAVTDISWVILSSGKHVLSTCADDQTVRLYDGESYELLHVVNTRDVYGWHTLTYMCVTTEKDVLFVSTQHGYLVAWDLTTFERICCRKMHSGSIEGIVLTSNQKSLVTIGSDCVVNCLSLENF